MDAIQTDTSIQPSKACAKCGQVKPISDFHIDRAQRDSRKASCRLCTNAIKAIWRNRNPDRVLPQKRESYLRNRESYLANFRSPQRRERLFEWKLMHFFGITVDQFWKMHESQGGCCAICGLPPSEAAGHRNKLRLHVDHDHETGVVRGLLCNNCNAGLGYFGDSQQRLDAAIEYLHSSQGDS